MESTAANRAARSWSWWTPPSPGTAPRRRQRARPMGEAGAVSAGGAIRTPKTAPARGCPVLAQAFFRRGQTANRVHNPRSSRSQPQPATFLNQAPPSLRIEANPLAGAPEVGSPAARFGGRGLVPTLGAPSLSFSEFESKVARIDRDYPTSEPPSVKNEFTPVARRPGSRSSSDWF